MARNLIVVVADTLRHPEFLPGFADGGLMPFLSGMLSKACVLDRVIASSCWTPPSHVSLLSGLGPWQTHFHLVKSVHQVPEAPFIGDLWRKDGGSTIAFSANFLVSPALGTARGYDQYNPGLPTRVAGVALQGLQAVGFEQLLYKSMARALRPGSGGTANFEARAVQIGGLGVHKALLPFYAGDRLEHALSRHLRLGTGSAPVHLFVNLMEAHEPYFPHHFPDGGTPELGYLPTVNYARHTGYLSRTKGAPGLLKAYTQAVRDLDKRWQGIFTLLHRHGLLNDAAVLFVSDHGQALGEHGFYGHGFFLHDELVRIPAYYWEFQGGKPVELPKVTADWVDHRHLFDLLSASVTQPGMVSPQTVLAESLERRGPAVSYWEGPTPRPPGGFLRPAPRSEFNRVVRVMKGSESVQVSEVGQSGTLLFDPGAEGSALSEYAAGLLGRGRVPDSGSQPAEVSPEVDGRLRSWGYD
ncbi:MAG: sulfatase-like hydrolase/transferase [Thermoplasmata archaeon]|nr:sulfatase-like hydrolase/transferase [Thermoplasmata archaeon]